MNGYIRVIFFREPAGVESLLMQRKLNVPKNLMLLGPIRVHNGLAGSYNMHWLAINTLFMFANLNSGRLLKA